jgi:streptogramin lyase
MTLGSGEYRYRSQADWAKLPSGWVLGDVAGVAVDRNDRVYLFNRGPHPMIVLDREGNFVKSWGEGVFSKPHGVHIGPDDTIYCTDDGDHTVRKCTLDGKLLLQLGEAKAPAPMMSCRPFCRCTHTALSPSGDIYVSDGYANACVHKYSPDGRLIKTWGEPGCRPGQFNLPHNICCDADGWVYVVDRENHRIQIFDGDGRYETQINNLFRPSALAISGGSSPVCFIGEISPYLNVSRKTPNLGPRISITTCDGKLLSELSASPMIGEGPGQFYSPHGIGIDSRGDLYVGEVSVTAWGNIHPDVQPPARLRSIQKLVKVQ